MTKKIYEEKRNELLTLIHNDLARSVSGGMTSACSESCDSACLSGAGGYSGPCLSMSESGLMCYCATSDCPSATRFTAHP